MQTVPPYSRKNVDTIGRKLSMARVKGSNGNGTLAEVVDLILDKGMVIDVWARVSLIGIEILTIEARVVIASVEVYLNYADAIRLTATAATPTAPPPETQVAG